MQVRDAAAAVIRKLSLLSSLDDTDRQAIAALPFRTETCPRSHFLVSEGDIPVECCVLVQGFACRSKVAVNGGRQIVSFHIPGDILDVQHLLLAVADHNLQTITESTVAWVKKTDLLELRRLRPAVGDALWKDTLVDASVFREWVLNLGRRDGKSRIAHMLCEFVARCQALGLGSGDRFELPFTQEQIADATGLTPVHTNRMIKALRQDGAIEISNGQLRVNDWSLLKNIAGFDPSYLHRAAAA